MLRGAESKAEKIYGQDTQMSFGQNCICGGMCEWVAGTWNTTGIEIMG